MQQQVSVAASCIYIPYHYLLAAQQEPHKKVFLLRKMLGEFSGKERVRGPQKEKNKRGKGY